MLFQEFALKHKHRPKAQNRNGIESNVYIKFNM